MKEIRLNHGKTAIVDDEDYEKLNCYHWMAHFRHQNWYAYRHVLNKNKKYTTREMQRDIMGLDYKDPRKTDHIDHDGLHNWRSNLRVVSNMGNCWNKKGVKGYFWSKSHHAFEAKIKVNYQSIFLGRYANPDEAHQAYLDAKKELHVIKNLCPQDLIIVRVWRFL